MASEREINLLMKAAKLGMFDHLKQKNGDDFDLDTPISNEDNYNMLLAFCFSAAQVAKRLDVDVESFMDIAEACYEDADATPSKKIDIKLLN